jgi:hypothetical protein
MFGGAGISLGAKGIAAAQGDAVPEFAQEVDDVWGLDRGHGQEQRSKAPNGSAALPAQRGNILHTRRSLGYPRHPMQTASTTRARSSGTMGDATGIHGFLMAPQPNPPPPAGTTADMILRRDTDGLYEIF